METPPFMLADAVSVRMPDADAWTTAKARYDRALRHSELVEQLFQEGSPEEQARIGTLLDALGEEFSDAQWALMGTPAPDKAALRWKFDHVVFLNDDGYINCWSMNAISQVIADYRRILAD